MRSHTEGLKNKASVPKLSVPNVFSGHNSARLPPDATDRIEPLVWKIAGVVILGMIMSILDTTIVNVALHTLQHDLHSSISQIQWVVTGYLLSLAAVIPVTGWAARRYGAKRVYLTSLVLFTAGSGLCVVAASTTSLVLFRVLQGAGGGMIMPVGQLIMAQVAGPKRMGRVMGVVSMPAMLAPIFGPIVGGTILQNLHWSWIFLVNLPIGVVAFVLAWRVLPHTDSGEAGRLDVRGLALLSTASTALVYGLSQAGTHASLTAPSWFGPPCWAHPRRRVLLARPAHRASAARRAAVHQSRVRRRVADHVRSRRCAVRRDDPRAALLPGSTPRERDRHRAARGPQGLGMLIVMPLTSRLTQRFGGGAWRWEA